MFKPMLACSTIPTYEEIKYPVIASHKLDGIRCLIVDGVPVSRNLKPIPNLFIRRELTKLDLPELDGELMVEGDFNDVQSAVMTEKGEPNFSYIVFDDRTNPTIGYKYRLDGIMNFDCINRIRKIYSHYVDTPEEMKECFDMWYEAGYEGAIVRDPNGPYKFGRSTLRQGYMLKLKKFFDAEAEIIDTEELMHNDNEATFNVFGHQVRSSHIENQHGGETLGSLVVKFKGIQFKIGSGFTAAERSRLWSIRHKLPGQLTTFKYQDLSKYGVPRFPVYKGIRDKGDL